jgi:proteasome lid subunit RPN8/RPN11
MSAPSGAFELMSLASTCERTVYPHVFGNSDREVGGVLVGWVSPRGELPLVTGAIEAQHAAENRAHLTFTQDTWEHAHRELESRGRSERIVGWYHSHPAFGIFLSEQDQFVHRSFFSDPAQVALVVDPLKCAEGLFAWQDGELRLLFERDTPARWGPAAGEAHSGAATHPVLVHLAVLLLGVLVGLALYVLVVAGDPPRSRSAQPAKPAARQQQPTDRDLVGASPEPPAGTEEIDGTHGGDPQ